MHAHQRLVHSEKMTLGAFPHTKKARFESRFKSRLFLRVSTQAEKSAIWIATIFYACPHRQKKSLSIWHLSKVLYCTYCIPMRTECAYPTMAHCWCHNSLHCLSRTERPPCMMGYKKPVRFSFTVLTHFAQKIIATFLPPHIKIKITARLFESVGTGLLPANSQQ